MVQFPLSTVSVRIVPGNSLKPGPAKYACAHFSVNEKNLFLHVVNVACYQIEQGKKISISPYKDADDASISLFLNGSALGAVLHQQGKLPLHGSSFEYRNKGIVICGCSGAGKSSVTMAFCQNGAHFINDDITPLDIASGDTKIVSLHSRMKLWDDSFLKLSIAMKESKRIRPTLNKFYLSVKRTNEAEQKLDQVIILGTHQKNEFEVQELKGTEKFNVLRTQIYRKAYLKGMPETQKKYFGQLLRLAGSVPVTRVVRPQICDIYETMHFIEKIIG